MMEGYIVSLARLALAYATISSYQSIVGFPGAVSQQHAPDGSQLQQSLVAAGDAGHYAAHDFHETEETTCSIAQTWWPLLRRADRRVQRVSMNRRWAYVSSWTTPSRLSLMRTASCCAYRKCRNIPHHPIPYWVGMSLTFMRV